MTTAGTSKVATRRRRAHEGFIFRTLEVLRTTQLTPRLRRITLGGRELRGFGEDRTGPNVKIYIPQPGQTAPLLPERVESGELLWPPDDVCPAMRTYTVRRHDPVACELDIDFVLHGHGVAGTWAAQAQPGDRVGIAGPGGKTVQPADWTLLVADQAGLPAVAKLLENAAAGMRGEVIIAVPGPEEELPLTHPPGIGVRWLHTGLEVEPAPVVAAVRALSWPQQETAFAWISAESQIVRNLRDHTRKERGLSRPQTLCIGYWRRGMNENQYHETYDNDRDDKQQ